MSDEVRELRVRMKEFIDGPVMKAEHEAERLAEADLHPDTGLPMELYAAAEAKGLDTSRGVPGPGDGATRRSTGPIAELQAEAKARGLWALGHPEEIGGGGLPFMDFVYLNEIIGRSEIGPGRGRHGHDAGLDHAPPVRRRRPARALPGAPGGRRPVPVRRPHRAGGRRQRPDADADHRLPRRRRVGHQRPQVVHVRRVTSRLHDRVRQDRARRREARAVQLDHRPHRHARLPDPAGGADDGPRRRPALRGRVRQRARAARRTCSATAARGSSSARSGSARAASSTACAGSGRRSGPSS